MRREKADDVNSSGTENGKVSSESVLVELAIVGERVYGIVA